MSIDIKDDEVYTIFIDDVELENDVENFITPKHLLKDKNVNDIPEGIVFDICWQHIENVIHFIILRELVIIFYQDIKQ
jgi:hypothetical protein